MGLLDALIFGYRQILVGGSPLPLRSKLNFVLGNAADNSATESTDVTIGTNLSGTFASRPAPGIPGRRFVALDGGGAFVDTGSSWFAELDGGIVGAAPPAAGSFTSLNLGFNAIHDFNGGLILNGGAADGATIMRGWYQASDGFTTDFVQATIAPFHDVHTGAAYPEAGILMRENSSGKMMTLALQLQANGDGGKEYQITFYKWNSNTTFASQAGWAISLPCNGPLVLRLRRNPSGSNYVAEYSRDPNAPAAGWSLVAADAGAFTLAIDQVGLWQSSYNTPANAYVRHYLKGH